MISNLQSTAELSGLPADRKQVLFFWADWHEPSRAGGQMELVVRRLAELHASNVSFLKVEAEAVPELSAHYAVSAVPTFVLLREGRVLLEKVEGANPPELTRRVALLAEMPPLVAAVSSSPGAAAAAAAAASSSSSVASSGGSGGVSEAMRVKLTDLINSSSAMLFMKGSAAEPRCKFSRKMVGILSAAGISYGTFDILTDDGVRQGLKKFSNWPTYPQLYVNGALAGGIDVIEEMADNGGDVSLADQLGIRGGGGGVAAATEEQREEALNARLRRIIGEREVMLFMKGTPDTPRCGFSRTAVALLRECNVGFGSFDILEDDEVRQGLKKFSNWPTYPQLYARGELVGGLDIMKEMQEEGDFASQIGVSPEVPLEDRLRALVDRSHCMLFMKGSPDEPRCGFSNKIVGILRAAGHEFDHFDILEDNDVRQGLKTFSNWPTFPQLYIGGDLIGGLDIVEEMSKEGDLADLFAPAKTTSVFDAAK